MFRSSRHEGMGLMTSLFMTHQNAILRSGLRRDRKISLIENKTCQCRCLHEGYPRDFFTYFIDYGTDGYGEGFRVFPDSFQVIVPQKRAQNTRQLPRERREPTVTLTDGRTCSSPDRVSRAGYK